MFVFTKKKIYKVLSILIIIIILFQIYIAIKNIGNKEISVATVALPVSNKVIVLDAGHGFPDNRRLE